MATILGFTPEELTFFLGLFYLLAVVPLAISAAIIYAIRTTPESRNKKPPA